MVPGYAEPTTNYNRFICDPGPLCYIEVSARKTDLIAAFRKKQEFIMM